MFLTDETILEGFKNLQDIIASTKEFNQLANKLIDQLLEASQFRGRNNLVP